MIYLNTIDDRLFVMTIICTIISPYRNVPDWLIKKMTLKLVVTLTCT